MNRKLLFVVKAFTAVLAMTLITVSLFACVIKPVTPSESSSEPQSSPEGSTPEESTPETSEPETEPAKEPVTLKIASYNIANGFNFKRINAIGKDIKEQNLDIVGLQEVDQFVSRSGNVDSMKLLSEASELPYYTFFKAIDLQGGEYGVGVLSRYPIVETERTEIYSGTEEQRVLGHAVIDVDGYMINFFVTHLSFESKSLRDAQFATIAEKTAELDNFIITGDFNTSNFSEFAPIKNSDMVNNASHSINTFPSSTPTSSIDNIVFSKNNWSFESPSILLNQKSDHCMLYATGTFDPN